MNAIVSTLAVAALLTSSPAPRPADEAARRTLQIDLDDTPISSVLSALDDQTRRYHEHITTLANPFFEGRAPGWRGNDLAAEYIAFYFRHFGLEPAFPTVDAAADGTEVITPRRSYYQEFSSGRGSTLRHARFWADGLGSLSHDTQFAALAHSGTSAVEDAPLVFVGYGIERGREGYTSYEDQTDLTGKVAIVLRFEPMDEQGRSRWLPGGWSPNAALDQKFQGAVSRGAAGVILVNPPGAADDRIGRLESVRSIRPSRGELGVPVVQLTPEDADRLVRRADPDGRSLLDLRRMADEGAAVVDLPGSRVSIDVAIQTGQTLTNNVGGILPGRGSLASELLVIGAHFDHVGYAYEAGSLSGARGVGRLHPGADDNGSGTSGMLLVAEAMAETYRALPPDAEARSVLFMGFSAEELGLIGSRHYVNNPIAPIARHSFMINMDMIGRLRAGVMELGGVRTAPGLWEFIEPMVMASGLDVRPLPGGTGPSDHTNFYNAGMPVLFFHTLLHDEYHRPTDVSWRINHVGAVRVANLCYEVAMALALRSERFVRTTPTRPAAGGVRVFLGITGEDDPDGGVRIVSVGEGTPAERAGLMAGDLIVRWEDQEVLDQTRWRPMLRARSPGDTVAIVVQRDGQEITLTCVLGER